MVTSSTLHVSSYDDVTATDPDPLPNLACVTPCLCMCMCVCVCVYTAERWGMLNIREVDSGGVDR